MAIQLAGQLPVEALQLSPIWRCNILQKYFATFSKKCLQKTDLNIYGYLKFLLERRPTKEMTDDQLAELAPWSEKLQSIKNRM